MQLRLRALVWEAPGVVSLDLVAPDGGVLPAFTPGAHVDLRLPAVGERQYSLCGDPADRRRYRLAVREVAGGQVSRAIHQALRPGALLEVGTPRNAFPLLPAARYLFIAGGIGITALLPMLRATRDWTLLYCVRSAAEAPFLEEIRALPGETALHASAAGTRLDAAARLATVLPDTLVYCCGPEALMLAVEAATAHWPEGSVRFEWFAARSLPASAAGVFEVHCAASGITLAVPPGQSILAALGAAGINVPSSCEQGVCGTCECRVLEGEVEHRDSILSNAERATNSVMMPCVSRARGARLVLDL